MTFAGGLRNSGNAKMFWKKSVVFVILLLISLVLLSNTISVEAKDRGTPQEVQVLREAIDVLKNVYTKIREMDHPPESLDHVADAIEEVLEEWEEGGEGRDIFFDTIENPAYVTPGWHIFGFGGDIVLNRNFTWYMNKWIMAVLLVHEGSHINQWHWVPFMYSIHEADAIEVEANFWKYLKELYPEERPDDADNPFSGQYDILTNLGKPALIDSIEHDTDWDGQENPVDDDDDGDSVQDSLDNVPLVPNPDQTDTDGDGIGDRGDPSLLDSPLFDFTISPSAPDFGVTVTMTATATNGTLEGFSFIWYFGDGGTASGNPVTHVYQHIGDGGDPTFTVRLKVIDPYGETTRESRGIVVGEPVGGIVVPVDKFGLLAPYIGLASTILVATATTAIYVKRVKRRKEKQ